jgi:hypothetical protein
VEPAKRGLFFAPEIQAQNKIWEYPFTQNMGTPIFVFKPTGNRSEAANYHFCPFIEWAVGCRPASNARLTRAKSDINGLR